MHDFVIQDRQVLRDLADWIADRRSSPMAIRPVRTAELPKVTKSGIGVQAMWAALRDEVLPTAFPTDHPRYLAFVGGAPTPAAVIADVALSAASIYGGSELEAGDVVKAERVAMRWLCDLVGYPPQAHGVFVSGGSMANLSALVAARHGQVAPAGGVPNLIVAAASAHSSIQSAASIMGCEVISVGTPDQPLRADDLTLVLDSLDSGDVVAVVASAGATNTGAIDDLSEIAECCEVRGIWFHVDAAYGGAALLAPSRRDDFDGIQFADSVTIDPHKWLFTPFDCAAVLYYDPTIALAAHRQRAAYLDSVNETDDDNPADYATHLTRRARGLPVWASLVANGTDAYVDAVESCLASTGYAAKQIEASAHLELATEPQLSVVLFRRRGWEQEEYERWSTHARTRGILVTPTKFAGESVLRFCFVNPLTSTDDIDLVLNSLECYASQK